MSLIYVPKRNVEKVLQVPGQRALYDFNASPKIDFSGNGFTLSRTAPPLVELNLPPGRTGKRLTGSTDDIDTIGTSLIGDSDQFYVWAWIYIKDRNSSTNVFGRGKDGSGSGWSVGFTVSGTSVSASIVLVNPSTLQWTATNSVTLKQGWNFVAMVVQNTYGTEPSHVSAIYETSQARTGLTGHTQLRSSTVGSFVGAGASQGVGRSSNPIGAVGIKLVNGMTEAQVLAELKYIRNLTESAFRTPEKQDFLFVNAGAGGSTTVTVDAGSLTLTGQNVANTTTGAVGAGSLTLTGQSIGVVQTIAVTPGTLSLTGQDVTANTTVGVTAGSLTLTGSDVTVVPPSGSSSVAVDPGSLTLTGQSITGTVSVPVTQGDTTLTGQTVGVTITVPVVAGTLTLTGQSVSASVVGSTTISVDPGTLTLTGYDVTVTYTGGTKGGAARGKNLTLKQKKKLKAVISQEWLKAEETAKELFQERLKDVEPAKIKIEKLTEAQSLAEVIVALKALSKETVTLPEQQAVIKSINKTIIDKSEKPVEKVNTIEHRVEQFEKRLNDLEAMVMAVISEVM